MSSRYHPLEEGLWDDPKFDAGMADLPEAPFEERGFFAYLFSNPRQRPSGIYRATDGQLAEGSRLPLRRVTVYLQDLHRRSLIVRDGAWIFLPGYLKRQANSQRLLLGAARDVGSCESVSVIEAFSQRYPLYSKWSKDRLETIKGRSVDVVSECSLRAEQSRAEHMRKVDRLPTVSGFEGFWEAYPRKVGKQKAIEAWGKIQPDDALLKTILSAVAQQRTWPIWMKNGGESIPYPATWLNGRRWDDEPMTARKPDVQKPRRHAVLPPEAEELTPKARALIRGVIESLPDMPDEKASTEKQPW